MTTLKLRKNCRGIKHRQAIAPRKNGTPHTWMPFSFLHQRLNSGGSHVRLVWYHWATYIYTLLSLPSPDTKKHSILHSPRFSQDFILMIFVGSTFSSVKFGGWGPLLMRFHSAVRVWCMIGWERRGRGLEHTETLNSCHELSPRLWPIFDHLKMDFYWF